MQIARLAISCSANLMRFQQGESNRKSLYIMRISIFKVIFWLRNHVAYMTKYDILHVHGTATHNFLKVMGFSVRVCLQFHSKRNFKILSRATGNIWIKLCMQETTYSHSTWATLASLFPVFRNNMIAFTWDRNFRLCLQLFLKF